MNHPARRAQEREILRLAVPAFLALVAEPLFLLGDAAVVGHLGTEELAGLGIAAVVLQTVVGLCVFLAYGTTASVARSLGAGRRSAALAQGVDGLWLAVALGVAVTGVVVATAGSTVRVFGVPGDVTDQALVYLRIAALGIPALLVMLAATGVLRGLQDTRTPLVVAVVGNVANLGLNVLLVYGAHLGLAGSAVGSVVAQVTSATALTWVVVRAARRDGVDLRPQPAGIAAVGRAGTPLVLRTLTLRAALLVTAYAVARGASGSSGSPGGTSPDAAVATHQLAMTVWTFLAFVLDAIAIAAQAITGRLLGSGDLVGARATTRRMVQWGLVGGVVTGVLVAAASPVLGAVFTTDADVRQLLVPVLLVIAVTQPLAGVVFVLDGVLIGAGDGRYLARGGLLTLLVHAPAVLLVAGRGPGGGLVAVWLVLTVLFMGARAVVLLARARGSAWLVAGDLS